MLTKLLLDKLITSDKTTAMFMGTCTCTLQLAVRSTVHVSTYAKSFYPFTNATLTMELN